MILNRRTVVLSAAALAALARPGRSQNGDAGKALRYGISMADIPLASGQPDRGAGAYQFTG